LTNDDPFRRRRAIEMRTPRDTRFQPHTALGVGSEFDAIRRMIERWGPAARRIGDDAAVITTLGERSLIVSTDTSVENVHFRRDWLTPLEIGYRAAAAALSDLAAMGAKPLGMLVAMAIPEDWRRNLDPLSDGIGEAALAADAPVLGGDMSKSAELAITITVLGTARDVLYRTSARPGDSIYVTGRLGSSGDALASLQRGDQPATSSRAKFARPVPRIREGVWLAENGAVAAIDISDGLSADLRHVAAASRVVLNVDLDRIPLAEGVNPLSAIASGEEYELACTSPTDLDVEAFERRFNVPLTKIGTVTRGDADVVFTQNDSRVEAPTGYLHFA
jgi:thiamine-monophosphate kinase